MSWLSLLACLFGGAFFINALPHLIAGLMGRAFQSPFARPPGEGLSSSTVNVLWGFANLAIAYLLLCRVSAFDIRNNLDAVAAGLGGLMMGVVAARHFGRFNGGAPSPKD